MKAGADFKQAGDATFDADTAFGWLSDPAQNLEQCRFSGAVTSDDADHISLLDFKRHIPKRPEVFNRAVGRRMTGTVRMRTIRTVPDPHLLTNYFERRCRLSGNYVPESNVSLALALMAQGVAFAHVVDGDDYVRHKVRNAECRLGLEMRNADCGLRIWRKPMLQKELE